MRTFKKSEIGIPMLAMISSLVGAAGTAFADNAANPDAKPVYNSLESLQLNCAAADGQQESDRDFSAKILSLASSPNPADRISALSQLTGKTSVEASAAQKILQAAIRDADSDVRAQAVYAIAKQNCADVPLILEQAMQDSELSVRLMAVDSSDERSTHLLEQAINDEEEAIRELAAMKLETLSK